MSHEYKHWCGCLACRDERADLLWDEDPPSPAEETDKRKSEFTLEVVLPWLRGSA